MIWFWLALIILVVAAGWYLFRPHPSSVSPSRREIKAREERLQKRLVRDPADIASLGDVRGLTLKVPNVGTACAEARKNNDETFLTTDAPPLPLPQCDATHCECAYYAIPGRRSGKDRRCGDERRELTRFEPDKLDRRSGGDRRRASHDNWRGRA